jgi:hypothetical protein
MITYDVLLEDPDNDTWCYFTQYYDQQEHYVLK